MRSDSTEALQAKLGTLSVDGQSKLEKDTKKKEAKAEAKEEAAQKKKMVRSPRPPPTASSSFPLYLQAGPYT